MDAETFVRAIRAGVLATGVEHYRDMLETPAEAIKDPGVRSMVEAFARMDDAQKAAMRMFARHVMLDTISYLFGIIDGVSCIEGVEEDLVLSYGPEREVVSGDLLDYWWAVEQDSTGTSPGGLE